MDTFKSGMCFFRAKLAVTASNDALSDLVSEGKKGIIIGRNLELLSWAGAKSRLVNHPKPWKQERHHYLLVNYKY